MNKSIYSEIILSKTQVPIPLLQNGKTIDSRYNPEREAESLIDPLTSTDEFSFFILLGIGCGMSLKKLVQKFPQSRIIALERSQEDLDFLKQIESVNELSLLPNIYFCSADNLCQTLCSSYLPAKYGRPQVIEQRAWMQENADLKDFIQNELNRAFRIVSADYSVQSHFGKIWMHNILGNLQLLSKICEEKKSLSGNLRPDTNKTAVIVAAGPSLDKSIEEIIKNRDSYYIISTDTANKSLFRKNCKADAVISIDGQAVSSNHFSSALNKETAYFFDICANNSAAEYTFTNGCRTIFFTSGHPLGIIASKVSKEPLPYIFAGAGTVTIAALDLACKMGFKDIKVLGADFGYSDGKAYTKGTYLETLYSIQENRIVSSEIKYDKLMFRTPLIKKEEKASTEILEAYRKSFLDYLTLNNLTYTFENKVYLIKQKKETAALEICKSFSIERFFKYLSTCSEEEKELCLLPYIAYLKNKADKDTNFQELVKLAQSYIVSYNKSYEK